ncbi:MAG: aminoacyl-tRNA hydrolase [Actinobacteria bacterium]|nr:MAG: aminoacyl-tRNA hydrolase [Actinomycetota bacterium]
MRLVVGLRNPGPEYEGTRHNVGAEVVSAVAAGNEVSLRRAKRSVRADVAELHIEGAGAVLAVPRVFMNESGQVVAPLLRYYGADPAELLVVHDDIDLPFAKLRVAIGRGAGGHNGVRSIIGSLRGEAFWRLKVGVGRPPGRQDPADFVLRRFGKVERPRIDEAITRAVGIVERFVADGGEVARQVAGLSNKG